MRDGVKADGRLGVGNLWLRNEIFFSEVVVAFLQGGEVLVVEGYHGQVWTTPF